MCFFYSMAKEEFNFSSLLLSVPSDTKDCRSLFGIFFHSWLITLPGVGAVLNRSVGDA